ncbi:ankyrin repeat-containing domain protein [Daldinia vernicosa]|uniref:ankyrin repeat-containing domain protein n=1 Tax=Daldinia vernicosa TaxID=114800 RepID=UPI0020088E8A|nr:ankyrin repeat-containing domain protein [Daldinia vernicosa]KAI0853857.1 ankyrin repeat-containing domain protein [Daldinia vernicosa]
MPSIIRYCPTCNRHNFHLISQKSHPQGLYSNSPTYDLLNHSFCTTMDPRRPTTSITLSGDIIFRIVRSNFHKPKVILTLSETCRLYCGALDPLLYRADVLVAKERGVELNHIFDRMRRRMWRFDTPFEGLCMTGSLCTIYYNDMSALHWAVKANDSASMITARKSIKAALAHWPDYLHAHCGRMDAMTPLQLAAKYGADEMIQELIKTCPSLVDTRIVLSADRNPCKKFQLSEFVRFQPFKATSLHIAMLYGHVHIAETLARLTQDLEDCQETPGTFSPLKFAAMCKMPSVIKILQARGYKVLGNEGYLRDTRYTPVHFAASSEDNEETLQLLLDTGYSTKAVDNNGLCPIGIAIKFRCVSNALFRCFSSGRHNSIRS